MTHSKQKERRKEKVKHYLKQLKAMVPPTMGSRGKMGTLSALQHVVQSMKKIQGELSPLVVCITCGTPTMGSRGKMGTLTALQHVVQSMKKIQGELSFFNCKFVVCWQSRTICSMN